VADARTAAHDQDGVAVAIDALLAGQLGTGWRAPGVDA
jgi:hypothetical protein